MRNAEVIRQWQILREIESRRVGVTIHDLARLVRVSTRTIRRDLQALQEAGFAVFDEGEDNETKRWKLDVQPFRMLQEGLTVSDVAALYLSRTLVEAMSGWPLAAELRGAFEKIERSLNERMREFLATLPQVLSAKGGPGRGAGRRCARGRHPPAARRDARTPRGLDALLLREQEPREELRGPAVPAGAGQRRRLSDRLGRRVRGVPDVRDRADREALRERRDVPPHARSARQPVRPVDGRVLGRTGACRTGVRRRARGLRPRPRLARVAGDPRTAGRPARRGAARLERLGAAELAARIRRRRAGDRAAPRWRRRCSRSSSAAAASYEPGLALEPRVPVDPGPPLPLSPSTPPGRAS